MNEHQALLGCLRRAIIATLRKNGDSEDSLDYRPIALLSSVYKIFTKIVASRLQLVLPRLTGVEKIASCVSDSLKTASSACRHRYSISTAHRANQTTTSQQS